MWRNNLGNTLFRTCQQLGWNLITFSWITLGMIIVFYSTFRTTLGWFNTLSNQDVFLRSVAIGEIGPPFWATSISSDTLNAKSFRSVMQSSTVQVTSSKCTTCHLGSMIALNLRNMELDNKNGVRGITMANPRTLNWHQNCTVTGHCTVVPNAECHSHFLFTHLGRNCFG